MKFAKKLSVKQAVAAATLMVVTGMAMAQTGEPPASSIDVSQMVAGINDTGLAIKTVLLALISMSIGIFGLSKLYSFLKRKAGA